MSWLIASTSPRWARPTSDAVATSRADGTGVERPSASENGGAINTASSRHDRTTTAIAARAPSRRASLPQTGVGVEQLYDDSPIRIVAGYHSHRSGPGKSVACPSG